jgi:hypothetical protein
MLRAGRDEGEVRFWLDDGHTSQILASLLDASEFDRIKRLTAGGIGEAQRLIEAKIVEAARKTVSGESSSEAAWEQARLVMQLAQESESATR